MNTHGHITVLREEAINALAIKESGTYVDATLGAGGHARHIIENLGVGGVFVGIDADKVAIQAQTTRNLNTDARVTLVCGNFRDIDSILNELHIEEVDGILADLGWRIEQMGGNGRGFSFLVDEPLKMTYGEPEKYSFNAEDIVNEWEEHDIVNVLSGYGEERFARRIAHALIVAREKAPIKTTYELVDVIKHAVPSFYRNARIHPATRTFQALRIAVNDEFDALETFLYKAMIALRSKGRLAVITFHSLEDRIVKHTFRTYAECGNGTVCTKKPITASKEELHDNPRARSAKLRVFEKI